MPSTYTEDDCLAALRDAADDLGHPPSYTEYKTGPYSPGVSTIERRCGSFDTAKERAGLDTFGVTKADCIDALRGAADDLGHSPTYTEYLELGRSPCAMSILNTFDGEWNAAKAAADLETYHRGSEPCAIDQTYFRAIDTAAKAYWLGFLLGDGSVRSKDGYGHALALELQRRDGHHVRAFADAVGSEYAVTDAERHVDVTRTSISDQRFVGYLMRAGIRPGKPRVPDVPTEYDHALIRGLFDADGTVYTRKGNRQASQRGSKRWYITTTREDHANEVARRLTDLGVPPTVTPVEIKEPGWLNQYRVCVNGSMVPDVARVCWPDGVDTDPCLTRKAESIIPE